MRKIVIIALMALVAAFAFADEATDTLSSEVLTLYAEDGIDFTVAAGDVLTLTGPSDGEGNAFSAVLTLPDGTQEVVTGTLADGLCGSLSLCFDRHVLFKECRPIEEHCPESLKILSAFPAVHKFSPAGCRQACPDVGNAGLLTITSPFE